MKEKSKPAKEKTSPKESDGGTLVRIGRRDKEILQALSVEEGEAMPRILHKALEVYRRQKFLDQVNDSYSKFQVSEGAWKRENEERDLWNSASSLND